MNMSDLIQIAILFVLLGTLVIVGWQTVLQNKFLRAQLLRDRFEMYWKTYEPVTDDEVAELQRFPEDYMDRDLYDRKYAGHEDRIRKYISMLQLYEYLAFTHGLQTLGLEDPLGYEWTRRWTRDLIHEEEFLEVHNYHRFYYERFAKFIDSEIPKIL